MDYSFPRSAALKKMSDRLLDSWEKVLENIGVNLREVIIEEYVRKLFQLITQFKSTINRHAIQEDWSLKTRNHLEKLEKNVKYKKLKKFPKLRQHNSNFCILHVLHVLIVMINFLILNIIFLNFKTPLFQILKTSIILFI